MHYEEVLDDAPDDATARAIARLGRDRAIAFLRAIRGAAMAFDVELVNDKLDAGVPLERIFAAERGLFLAVKGRGRRFRIGFGRVVAPLMGSGATWDVEFGPDGEVTLGKEVEFWIT